LLLWVVVVLEVAHLRTKIIIPLLLEIVIHYELELQAVHRISTIFAPFVRGLVQID
jgi:hypothetical protein